MYLLLAKPKFRYWAPLETRNDSKQPQCGVEHPIKRCTEAQNNLKQLFCGTGHPMGAVRAARGATIWASGRTRDPYFEILGAPRGIMVTRSGGFEF